MPRPPWTCRNAPFVEASLNWRTLDPSNPGECADPGKGVTPGSIPTRRCVATWRTSWNRPGCRRTTGSFAMDLQGHQHNTWAREVTTMGHCPATVYADVAVDCSPILSRKTLSFSNRAFGVDPHDQWVNLNGSRGQSIGWKKEVNLIFIGVSFALDMFCNFEDVNNIFVDNHGLDRAVWIRHPCGICLAQALRIHLSHQDEWELGATQ